MASCPFGLKAAAGVALPPPHRALSHPFGICFGLEIAQRAASAGALLAVLVAVMEECHCVEMMSDVFVVRSHKLEPVM